MERNVELLMALKLSWLHKNGLPNLSMEQFTKALDAIKWREGKPLLLHEVVEDIFSCSANEIVAHLAQLALVEARHQTLAQYAQQLGGNRFE